MAPITQHMINTGPFCHNICSGIITVAIKPVPIYNINNININKICIYFIGSCHMIIPFHICFPTSYCSDEAVIGQYNLNDTFLLLTATSHCRHFTVILSLLSQYASVCTVIALLSHCNATSTLPYNYLLILPDGLTVNILRWRCQLYNKTTSALQWKKTAEWLRVFSNFENCHSARRQDCEHDGEITNDDSGTNTICVFVNFCSSRLVVVVPSSSVKGA